MFAIARRQFGIDPVTQFPLKTGKSGDDFRTVRIPVSSVDKKLDSSVISIKSLHGQCFAIKNFRRYGVLRIQFFNRVPCGEHPLGASKLFI